jgi:hypothetical protein
MIPREFAIASPSEAGALGLPEKETGIIFAEGDAGPVTLAGDPDFVRMLYETPPHLRANLEIPAHKFPTKRRGW